MSAPPTSDPTVAHVVAPLGPEGRAAAPAPAAQRVTPLRRPGLHPPGWTEISAVCTDPRYRGQGLATRLVRAVAHGIRHRGETPLLHASASNTAAIDLYLSIGFRLRRRTTFDAARVPGNGTA